MGAESFASEEYGDQEDEQCQDDDDRGPVLAAGQNSFRLRGSRTDLRFASISLSEFAII